MKTNNVNTLKEYKNFILPLSENTRKQYFAIVRRFLKYLESSGLNISKIDERTIERFAGDNRNNKTSARHFLMFLRHKKYCLTEKIITQSARKKPETREDPINPCFTGLIESYIRKIKTAEISERTIKIIRSYIRRFLDYLTESNITEIAQVNKKVMSDYSLYLLLYRFKRGKCAEARPYSPASRHQILVQVRSFFDFLRKENIVLFNPADGLQLPKLPKSISRDIPGFNEVDRILEAIDRKTAAGIRNYAVIETLYSTGLRAMELIKLKIEDVDFENRFISVKKGKYGKPRTVPVSTAALSAIDEYLEKSRPLFSAKQPDDKGFLFLSIIDGAELSTDSVEDIIESLARKAGIKKHLIPHSLRYACATHMMRNGADIRFVQEMLGHKSIRTTQGYTQVVKGDLKRAMRKYHPREADFIGEGPSHEKL
jgi:integrase/recombinase XerD